jgi:hypothetical protein
MKRKIRLLKESEVTFTLECEPEDLPVRGNAMASGNPDVDRETEQWIFAQLASGNDWAWCCVKVTAEWNGFEGVDYLGTCSYRSEEEFRSDAYFADMKTRALEDLNETLQATGKTLSQLETEGA